MIMSTYTQILYQIVFSTFKREETLTPSNRQELFRYIAGILQNKKCHLYRINGVFDHLHNLFPDFDGWQDGYGAFTYSFRDKDKLIEYVKNQEIHHQVKTSRDELIELLDENGVEYDEEYFI